MGKIKGGGIMDNFYFVTGAICTASDKSTYCTIVKVFSGFMMVLFILIIISVIILSIYLVYLKFSKPKSPSNSPSNYFYLN
jgi:hypothetical protein